MNKVYACAFGIILASTNAVVSATDYVIAVIDPNRVVEQSPQYESARAQLQQEVSEREKQLLEQQAQIEDLQKKLEGDSALMSEDEIQRLQNDIRNRDRKIKYAQAEFRDDFALRQNELRTKLAQQVEEVVEELAKEEKIDLIVSEGLVYYSKRIDISDKVVERLRKKFEAK
ncbi:MAG: OmpH family outer membrane protein [Pseudomonadota bacterium]|nr:OmpH family outer membrane protein [Pseudomonadota bacterium]